MPELDSRSPARAGAGTAPTSERLTLTDASAAQLVLQATRRRFLEPFVDRACTTAEAAREIGVSVEQMAYRVQVMTRARLLSACGERRRAGRTIIVYRAPAEICAPLRVLDEGDANDFFRTVDEPMRQMFLAAVTRRAGRAGLGDWVVRLYRDDGRIRVDLAPDSGAWDPAVLLTADAPAVILNWVPLVLSSAEAKALQHELSAVLARFAERVPQPGEEPSHLLGLFLTALD
ncbi:hypothetical protein [Dactylosporangium matsuzakiense]|nr:hypothetical protein [Dactylosporangium matsuzakiense]